MLLGRRGGTVSPSAAERKRMLGGKFTYSPGTLLPGAWSRPKNRIGFTWAVVVRNCDCQCAMSYMKRPLVSSSGSVAFSSFGLDVKPGPNVWLSFFRLLYAVSYTHLTLPT